MPVFVVLFLIYYGEFIIGSTIPDGFEKPQRDPVPPTTASKYPSLPSPGPGVDNDPVFDVIGEQSHYRSALENPPSEFFGGDMILSETFFMTAPRGAENNGVVGDEYKWPGFPGAGYIPYVIDESLYDLMPRILSAMQQFNNKTCIRFYPRQEESTFINITKGEGCWSYVGRREDIPGQEVSLGDGCEPIGTIVHELNHCIGFYHEQNRSDRDDWLKINFDNIQEDAVQNFKKLTPDQNQLFNDFDYNSIMIYGNDAFAKTPGAVTMEAIRDPKPKLYNPYSKSGLDTSDVYRINMLYGCLDSNGNLIQPKS